MLVLHADNLKAPGIAHGFFGRSGGVSGGLYASLNCGPGSGDARDSVLENRRRAGEALRAGAALVTLHQVHSARAVIVAAPWKPGSAPEADAMATATPGVALGILTAYLLTRQRFVGQDAFEFGTMLSFVIPGTVIGVS